MTANEMRAALRDYCVLRSMTIDDLEAMDEYSLRPIFKSLIGKPGGATNASVGPQFVVNDAGLTALAQRVKASIGDTALTVNDLAKLPIARLRELARQHDWSSYDCNNPDGAVGFARNSGTTADADEGELLRAVTALKNAVQGAGPGALATLGLATLEGWRMQVEQAVGGTSAGVARNAARHSNTDLPRRADDEFAGYDMNAVWEDA